MTKYIELYKKYRPRTWSEVVGQDNAVKQLQKCVQSKNLPTAFGFIAGPGQGKTTLALILAKSLNCENLNEDGSPCNQCDMCKALDNDPNSVPGIRYFSAANNGSVDDMRKIVEEARLKYPVTQPVFIIDEVHNLSHAAQDALLLPLESDNMNTLFIFCTTEGDKLRPAVLTRLQVINFPPVHFKLIAQHLYKIAKKENIELSKETAIMLAREANGSMRQAISNMESYWNSGKLATSNLDEIIVETFKGNIPNVLNLSSKLKEDGLSYSKSLESVYKILSETIVYKSNLTTSSPTVVVNISDLTNLPLLFKALDIVGDAMNKIQSKVVDTEVLFNIPLIKIATMINKIKEK